MNASEGEWGGDRKRWRVECKNRRRIKFEGLVGCAMRTGCPLVLVQHYSRGMMVGGWVG